MRCVRENTCWLRALQLEQCIRLDIFIKHHIFHEFLQLVATSGRPEEVTSHNGTNFDRGKREIRELVQAINQERIAENAASKGIRQNWVHCGVSESLIQVAKKILKATVGNAGLTNDGVQTSIKVEALMNSRPLKYGGADHRDETVLKPNHFLFGQPG